jgi:hypothetical protein
MRQQRTGLIAALMALTGCGLGGGVCGDVADAYSAIAQKGERCSGVVPLPAPLDLERCEQNLEQCTDRDRALLEEKARCLQEIEACQAGGEQASPARSMRARSATSATPAKPPSSRTTCFSPLHQG